MKRKLYDDFDQWLADNSRLNSELTKENEKLLEICDNLFANKHYATPINNIVIYQINQGEITTIMEDRNELISSLNRAINDYWRERNLGIVENDIITILEELIRLSSIVNDLLKQSISLLTPAAPTNIVNFASSPSNNTSLVKTNSSSDDLDLDSLFRDEEIAIINADPIGQNSI